MFNKDLNKLIRSSRLQMFFRICVLQDFAIFTGKNLRWSLFLITLDALLKGLLRKTLLSLLSRLSNLNIKCYKLIADINKLESIKNLLK